MQFEYSDHDRDSELAPGAGPQHPPSPPPPGPQRPRMVPVQGPSTRPIAAYILLAIIVGIYLLGQIVPLQPVIVKGYLANSAEDWLFIQGAKLNEFIIRDREVYRLLTAMFLHGGLMHLFFNGYALYVIGTNVERVYGHARFLLVYFLGGLTGSLFSLLFSSYASVGASGAIFALFGAELVFVYRHRDLFGRAAYRQLQNMIFLLALNILIGLSPGSRIDNWGHIGGFLAGVGLSWLIGPSFRLSLANGRPWSAVELATPGMPLPALELVDDNPLQKRLFVPFAYAAVYVLILGVVLQRG
ncbi:MAG: rhomboid family intramembrane serine protease [Anaerolineae bacterium]|nr:rhomboid family intramembrane serine protease [Anaerolineae bacterium]